MHFVKALSLAIAVGVVAGGPASPAHAIFVSTTQLTAPSGPEPVWGQGITINVGADLPDASIPPTVELNFVGFRTGDPLIGAPGRTAVYLHVYDGFGINGDGTINGGAIGGLVAVSNNTVNLEAAAPTTDVVWLFDDPIAKDATYHYILANDTLPATSGGFSNLLFSDLQVALTNPYPGGQAYRQPGDMPSHDLFFRVISSFNPISSVPEPGTFIPAAIGLLSLSFVARRRRKRS